MRKEKDRMITLSLILIFLKVFLSSLFLTSGYTKISNFQGHLGVLKEYKIIPENAVKLFGFIEVLVEIIIGIMILIGIFQKVTPLLALLILFIYTLAIIINLFRGRNNISCGCGGIVGNHNLSWHQVSRNILLMSLCGYLWYMNPQLFTIDGWIKSGKLEGVFQFKGFIYFMTSFLLIFFYHISKEFRKLSIQMVTLVKK